MGPWLSLPQPIASSIVWPSKGTLQVNLSDLLIQHGYWVLAVGCLLEGETILVMAGFAAHRGLMDLAWVLAIAATCVFLGDTAFFWLGRHHGSHLMQRWPSLNSHAQRLNRWTAQYNGWVIVGLRFAYGLRIAGPILIGMSPMPASRFQFFNAVGAVLWTCIISGVGWSFGEAAQRLLGEIQHLEAWLLLGIALGGASLASFKWLKSSRRH